MIGKKLFIYFLLFSFFLCGCAADLENHTLAGSGAETQDTTEVLPTGTTEETIEQLTTESTNATVEATEQFTTESTQETEESAAPPTTETVIELLPPYSGPIDTDLCWIPICQEFISLWASPSANKALTRIPVGEIFLLEQWYGKYALVTYRGVQGYVACNYMQPADENYFSNYLQIVTPTTVYTYQQMLADMGRLQALYPELVNLDSIGLSEEGRQIPVMTIGAKDAKYQVLIQGAIHGSEHFTAWLAMALADTTLLRGLTNPDICYHIIPMSNPDGVAISQSGTLNAAQHAIYQQDLALDYTSAQEQIYATQWKANALGVDLNRNFPSGWEDARLEHSAPSSEKYRGDAPFSAAESRALRDYTTAHPFNTTISLHSSGSVLFYQYGDRQDVNDRSYNLAEAVAALTGYIPTEFDNTTGFGYKDWAIEVLGIPSLTVEVGYYHTPITWQDMHSTFARCKDLLPTIYVWLCK